MKIPKKIKIGAHDYTIDDNYLFTERNDRIAHVDNVQQKIVISKRGSQDSLAHRQKVEEAFIHELLHGVDWVYNGAKLGEEVVERLSEGLYQVILQIVAEQKEA